ncbi:MAG: zinc-binding dehydrogenase [Paracoccaceae bacterium]|jgi:alcohol dehydrogenase|nr:alcohol dehydrogenase [Marinovum sp.]MDG1256271.1 zinc-binding dehydrogenase [Paracoccaceae bacterium]|tara:strand:+ start:482 stop:1606 length:1125 start_codon:yes stop_codon:yes gene_type:complete
MKIRAAVLRESGLPRPYCESKPLQIEEVELDGPKRGEVLVQIKAVGLCHSDLVAINGERGKPMPIVIGHEAAGIVVELGEGVQGFDKGDHVVPTYVASCGHCEMCAVGRPALCEPATMTNADAVLWDGTTRLHKNGQRIHHHSGVAGFAEYAVMSKDALIKIDKSIPFEHAALFGCGVVTGVGALLNTAGVKPGEHVAVVGLGGVGLSALLAAVAAGAGRIIALDLNPQKLQLARELGADFAINAADSDCVSQVREATLGGSHVAVETAGSAKALETAYQITRRGGTTVTAGMPGPEAKITLSHLSLSAEERCLKGSYMGSCVPKRDIPRYLSMFQDGKLPVDKLLSRTIGFNDLNAAMDRLDDAATVREILMP